MEATAKRVRKTAELPDTKIINGVTLNRTDPVDRFGYVTKTVDNGRSIQKISYNFTNGSTSISIKVNSNYRWWQLWKLFRS